MRAVGSRSVPRRATRSSSRSPCASASGTAAPWRPPVRTRILTLTLRGALSLALDPSLAQVRRLLHAHPVASRPPVRLVGRLQSAAELARRRPVRRLLPRGRLHRSAAWRDRLLCPLVRSAAALWAAHLCALLVGLSTRSAPARPRARHATGRQCNLNAPGGGLHAAGPTAWPNLHARRSLLSRPRDTAAISFD